MAVTSRAAVSVRPLSASVTASLTGPRWVVRQVADAEAGAAERRQEAAGQELPLEAERPLGTEDADRDAAADVPADAFAAVREALGRPPKQKGTKKPGAQAVYFIHKLLAWRLRIHW